MGDGEPREPGRLAAGVELVRERGREPVEHEPDGVEPLGRGIQRQPQGHPLRRATGPEPFRLLAPGTGVESRAFVAEPGDDR